jgi:hypothetical protein
MERDIHDSTELARSRGLNLLSLIVFGVPGSGKTTFINGLINSLTGRSYQENRLISISQNLPTGDADKMYLQKCNIPQFQELDCESCSSQSSAQTQNCTTFRIISKGNLFCITDTQGLDEINSKEAVNAIARHSAMLPHVDAIIYVHQNGSQRMTTTLKEAIDAYTAILPPSVVKQKFVVCFTHALNFYQVPQSWNTLVESGIMNADTKYFRFKNDCWLHPNIATQYMSSDDQEHFLLEQDSSWKGNTNSYKKLIETVSNFGPASTEAILIQQATEEAYRKYAQNLETFEIPKNKNLQKSVTESLAGYRTILQQIEAQFQNTSFDLYYKELGHETRVFEEVKLETPLVYCNTCPCLCEIDPKVLSFEISEAWKSSKSRLSAGMGIVKNLGARVAGYIGVGAASAAGVAASAAGYLGTGTTLLAADTALLAGLGALTGGTLIFATGIITGVGAGLEYATHQSKPLSCCNHSTKSHQIIDRCLKIAKDIDDWQRIVLNESKGADESWKNFLQKRHLEVVCTNIESQIAQLDTKISDDVRDIQIQKDNWDGKVCQISLISKEDLAEQIRHHLAGASAKCIDLVLDFVWERLTNQRDQRATFDRITRPYEIPEM